MNLADTLLGGSDTTTTTTASTPPAVKSNTGLYIGIGIFVVVVIAGIWYFKKKK